MGSSGFFVAFEGRLESGAGLLFRVSLALCEARESEPKASGALAFPRERSEHHQGVLGAAAAGGGQGGHSP